MNSETMANIKKSTTDEFDELDNILSTLPTCQTSNDGIQHSSSTPALTTLYQEILELQALSNQVC